MQNEEPLDCATAPADRLVGGLLYLMTQWPLRGASAPLALAIGAHLQSLADHPDTGAPLAASCLALREHWLQFAARCAAQARPLAIH